MAKLKKFKKLTAKQQVFVDGFCGNISASAKRAGYSNPSVAGAKLMRRDNIKYAIQNRNRDPVAVVEDVTIEQEADDETGEVTAVTVVSEQIVTNGDITGILSREARQKFFSDVITGKIQDSYKDKKGKLHKTPCKMSDRIKCAELLGRSEGDFIDRIGLEVGLQEELDAMTPQEVDNEIKELVDMGILDLIMSKKGQYEVVNGN